MNEDRYDAITKASLDGILNGNSATVQGLSLKSAQKKADGLAASHGEVYIVKVTPVAVYRRHVTSEAL